MSKFSMKIIGKVTIGNHYSLHTEPLLFFEYYEDELRALFNEKADYLLDYNFKCLETIFDCLQLELKFSKNTSYEKIAANKTDYRFLVQAKKEIPQQFEPYTQVFNNKHGFIANLSILDLLFNEGPNSLNYLESQILTAT